MCLCVSARARRNADNGGPFDPTGEGICYNFRYKIYLKYNTICKTLYIYIYIYTRSGVPFVDVMATMADPSIPLTVTEWEEWGNPNEARFHDYMRSYRCVCVCE